MAEALTPEDLVVIYTQGFFPMANESGEIEVLRPNERALFPIEGIRVSRSLAKTIKKGEYKVTFNQEFERVMRGCARPDGTWINEELIDLYVKVHELGWGHSCEVWMNGRLAGGLYGIAIGQVFFAESMFSAETSGSKLALLSAVDHCRALGFKMFDAQIMNPHLESLGAYALAHDEYIEQMTPLLAQPTPWSFGVVPRDSSS
jgi:leucyl/phenylalanyl-tRNA--protein transferase